MTIKSVLYLSVLLASVATAEGPVFLHKDPVAQQEFDNVYKDIRSVPTVSSTTLPTGSTNYVQVRTTLQPGATFFVSSGTVTELFASTVTAAALSYPTGARVKGTTTNDSANTGDYGETQISTTARANFPATGTWGDLTSKSITAGDWICWATCESEFIATTITRIQFGMSTTSGNSATGLTSGFSVGDTSIPTGAIDANLSLGPIHFSLNSTTTVYLKYKSTYSGTAPIGDGTLACLRIR